MTSSTSALLLTAHRKAVQRRRTARRAGSRRLIHREHAALGDFLVALADFDQRRAWEELGHASLLLPAPSSSTT